jgi:glycosyltransferase involved in cell wall biosynthesis
MEDNIEESLVTVVIPNYNQEKFVTRAVASVIEQSHKNVEIIVVDDGSTDSSILQLRRFGKLITIVLKENGGAASARNLGMTYSNGDFLCFLDADDFLATNFIQSQLSCLRKSGNKLAYCRMNIVDADAKLIGMSNESRDGNFKNVFQREFGSTPFPPSAMLIDGSVVRESIKWNTKLNKYAEDFEFIGKCAQFTDFSFNNEPLVFHTEHPESLTARITNDYLIDNLVVMKNLLITYHMFNPLRWTYGFLRIFKIYSLSVLKQKIRAN